VTGEEAAPSKAIVWRAWLCAMGWQGARGREVARRRWCDRWDLRLPTSLHLRPCAPPTALVSSTRVEYWSKQVRNPTENVTLRPPPVSVQGTSRTFIVVLY